MCLPCCLKDIFVGRAYSKNDPIVGEDTVHTRGEPSIV